MTVISLFYIEWPRLYINALMRYNQNKTLSSSCISILTYLAFKTLHSVHFLSCLTNLRSYHSVVLYTVFYCNITIKYNI